MQREAHPAAREKELQHIVKEYPQRVLPLSISVATTGFDQANKDAKKHLAQGYQQTREYLNIHVHEDALADYRFKNIETLEKHLERERISISPEKKEAMRAIAKKPISKTVRVADEILLSNG